MNRIYLGSIKTDLNNYQENSLLFNVFASEMKLKNKIMIFDKYIEKESISPIQKERSLNNESLLDTFLLNLNDEDIRNLEENVIPLVQRFLDMGFNIENKSIHKQKNSEDIYINTSDIYLVYGMKDFLLKTFNDGLINKEIFTNEYYSSYANIPGDSYTNAFNILSSTLSTKKDYIYLDAFLENGYHINTIDNNGRNALFFANESPVIKYLLDKNIDIDNVDKNNNDVFQYTTFRYQKHGISKDFSNKINNEIKAYIISNFKVDMNQIKKEALPLLQEEIFNGSFSRFEKIFKTSKFSYEDTFDFNFFGRQIKDVKLVPYMALLALSSEKENEIKLLDPYLKLLKHLKKEDYIYETIPGVPDGVLYSLSLIAYGNMYGSSSSKRYKLREALELVNPINPGLNLMISDYDSDKDERIHDISHYLSEFKKYFINIQNHFEINNNYIENLSNAYANFLNFFLQRNYNNFSGRSYLNTNNLIDTAYQNKIDNQISVWELSSPAFIGYKEKNCIGKVGSLSANYLFEYLLTFNDQDNKSIYAENENAYFIISLMRESKKLRSGGKNYEKLLPSYFQNDFDLNKFSNQQTLYLLNNKENLTLNEEFFIKLEKFNIKKSLSNESNYDTKVNRKRM